MHDFMGIAHRFQLRNEFPETVHREVDDWIKSPGLDDASLVDLAHLPFITIDNEDSRDLDQAMVLEFDQRKKEHRIFYALADASHFVLPGSALFTEAMKRGSTFYFPGFNIPMLPRALSEGLCSLNQDQTRRAMVVESHLDLYGECTSTRVYRARIRSRAKLSYNGVQAYYDKRCSQLSGQPFTPTLDALKTIGLLRKKRADERDVVRYDRVQSRIQIANNGISIVGSPRLAVESYNEEISLLANVQGALFLKGQHDPSTGLSGVYRVHPPPSRERLQELSRDVQDIRKAHGLDDNWSWNLPQESLADYLERLPDGRVAQALQRQALLCNESSYFSTEPAPHHGIGSSAYARFSSPMREMVGIITHHMAFDQLNNKNSLSSDLVDKSVEHANACKAIQKSIVKESNKIAMDHLFLRDLKQPLAKRPKRKGTVMGAGKRLYIQLDAPPLQIKVYDNSQNTIVGNSMTVTTSHYDEEKQRWNFNVL